MTPHTTTNVPQVNRRRGSYQASKLELIRRFRRLSGQIDGVAAMIEDERYCPDVLIQISSAIGALEKIGYILLRDHVQHCVVEGVTGGDGDEYLDELIAVIQRFSGR